MNKYQTILNKQSPTIITLLLLLGAMSITSLTIITTVWWFSKETIHPIDILMKMSPMVLPSLMSSIAVLQGQAIIKRNAKKDASDMYLRKSIFTQLEELKSKELKMENELSDMKERILKLEILFTNRKDDN